MKITSIKDLTDDALKQTTASEVSDFIATELKKTSEAWVTEKNQLTSQLSQAQEASKTATSEVTTLKETVKTLQASVETLTKEKTEREQVEAFNVRMSKVTEAFELDDDAKNAVVEEIKSIASEEDFGKWMKKASVLLKGYAKKKEDPKEKEKMKEKGGDCKASDENKDKTASATVIDNAVDNANKEKGGLPNNTDTAPKSLKEKYQSAFAKENFIIKV